MSRRHKRNGHFKDIGFFKLTGPFIYYDNVVISLNDIR